MNTDIDRSNSDTPNDQHVHDDQVQGLASVSSLPDIMPSEDQSSESLSKRQQMILEIITSITAERGYPPTLREIGAAVGLKSLSSVQYQLNVLQTRGYINRDATRARALEVRTQPAPTSMADDVTTLSAQQNQLVPLVGRIAAGGPILAEEAVEDVFALPKTLVGNGDLFMLTVVGDSMIDAAICDGDFVVVRSQPTCENGDIVAALIDGEATVKTFRRRDGHIWLMPHNPAYEPILGDEATIMGKVVSVLRKV